MGMFDSVILKCPNCQAEHEVQTKSGPNTLDTYYQNEVPIDIALGAIGRCVMCNKCDNEFRVKPEVTLPKTVALKLETES